MSSYDLLNSDNLATSSRFISLYYMNSYHIICLDNPELFQDPFITDIFL